MEGSLDEIMEKIYEGTGLDFLQTETRTVDSESEEYFLGTKGIEYEEALASEPLINAIPHSLVLLRVKDGADIENIKFTIKAKVDGRKWICVGVEEDEIITDNIGGLVVLIMDAQAEKFQESFKKLVQ